MARRIMVVLLFCLGLISYSQEHSVARIWNEALLEAIRNDYARPTVHARNLFHISTAMYDVWSIIEGSHKAYLIGNEVHGFVSNFDGYDLGSQELEVVKHKAISYAAYRLLNYRFQNSPNWEETQFYLDSIFEGFGYDQSFNSMDYSTGSAAALGNFIAEEYIQYGSQDGSNELNDYVNEYYVPSNEYLNPESSGNPNISDPNRWQPLGFNLFIDQSGNEIPGAVPAFLSPEWGNVHPFSFRKTDLQVLTRDGDDYQVYYNPGAPPKLGAENNNDSLYQWGFAMVAVWSSHLDPTLDVTLDISPKSLGNISVETIPNNFDEYDTFYNFLEGGDISEGREINPITGESYPTQMVKLGDYARVLAEFWADGPDSETPPGHWFTILNYVSDQPELEKKYGGNGEVLSDLEWDLKAYFILGGAMHDVAISAWGIKGYYDYVRPISAIRYMADQGQSSDPTLPSYHSYGIPLIEGYIELVELGDPLVGLDNENLNKIKIKAWKGPEYINNPEIDYAGVDWILAENWWPYQRPTFVTPPFAGFVSGHSTYSRAAAEVLTLLTGSEFFPGGVGEFIAKKDEFLVFEEGPSEDIILQWATYRDASDQCSLSRIWGGIHPAFDDIPGRLIGAQIGVKAYEFATEFFPETITIVSEQNFQEILIYPNPFSTQLNFNFKSYKSIELMDSNGKILFNYRYPYYPNATDLSSLSRGLYWLKINDVRGTNVIRLVKD